MVKVNYASLQTQSSTMSSVSQSRVAGFNQLLSAFNSFGDSGNELIGTGYDAARVYATSVMSPYYKGFILYSEAVADAANTLADNYVAKCGAENLDEEQLQAEIHHAISACISLGDSIVRLESVKQTETIKTRLNNLRNQYDAAQSQLTVAQEKLDKLLAFSAESLLACTSADTYQLLIYQAMSGISTSFGGGSFALPQDLSWVGDVEQGWADREIAMENNYLSALEKVNNGESLTEAELTAIERYAAAYPDRVDDSVIQYVQQARQVKEEEMKYRSIIDKVDAGKELTDEEFANLVAYAEQKPDKVSDVHKEKINKMLKDYRDAKTVVNKLEKKSGTNTDKKQTVLDYLNNVLIESGYLEEFNEGMLEQLITQTDKTIASNPQLLKQLEKAGITWELIKQLKAYAMGIDNIPVGSGAGIVSSTQVVVSNGVPSLQLQTETPIGQLSGPLSAGLAILDFKEQMDKGEDIEDAALKTGGHFLIGLAAGKAGAVIGAGIGSIVPGPGTAIGGAIGFIAGIGMSVYTNSKFNDFYDKEINPVVEKIKTAIDDDLKVKTPGRSGYLDNIGLAD